MMYASDRPILTGCFSSLIDSMEIGIVLYAKIISPVFIRVTLNVNPFFTGVLSFGAGVGFGASVGEVFFAELS